MAMRTDRYLELDLLRTIAIVMMVIYHAAFDLSFFFELPLNALSGGWFLLQRMTANLFLLLVGVSFAVSYGRMEARGASRREILMKYARRGAFVFLCGMLVTAVTAYVVPDAYVRFGVLHLIGVS
ncbi:MAG: heparan-alpha-glucosaminide N-acetyltransferase domain-containing protein, partial [Patescibacteria group bacterium]